MLDHVLMQKVLAENFTLVTNNSVDFRGAGPGQLGGHHSKTDIHCGLVCLNAQSGLDLDTQRALFVAALDLIERKELDLMNQALELFRLADGTLEYAVYAVPAAGTESLQSPLTGTLDFPPALPG